LFTFFKATASDSDMPLDSDWLFHCNVPGNHEKNTKDISDSAPHLDFDWPFLSHLDNFKGEKFISC
jgi:hypothetical protein